MYFWSKNFRGHNFQLIFLHLKTILLKIGHFPKIITLPEKIVFKKIKLHFPK